MTMREIRIRETELGTEKWCPRCEEWWPADPEFFWRTSSGLFYCCKACYHANDKRFGRRGNADANLPMVPEALRALPFAPNEVRT